MQPGTEPSKAPITTCPVRVFLNPLKNIPFDKELKNGVKDLVFDMEAQTVTVTYDANKTDVPALQKAFAKIGKPATTTKPEQQHDEHHHEH